MSARDPPNLRRWVEWALRRPESKVIEEIVIVCLSCFGPKPVQ